MLIPETPFPQAGSYALLVDRDAPAPQSNELVRILEWRRGARALVGEDARANRYALVSFPLRDGAGGNKIVAFADLIDATPLTGAETRDFHDLDRTLAGREPRNFSKAQRGRAARRDALRERIVHGPVLDRLLRFARSRERNAA